jgi:hypothetical protein
VKWETLVSCESCRHWTAVWAGEILVTIHEVEPEGEMHLEVWPVDGRREGVLEEGIQGELLL